MKGNQINLDFGEQAYIAFFFPDYERKSNIFNCFREVGFSPTLPFFYFLLSFFLHIFWIYIFCSKLSFLTSFNSLYNSFRSFSFCFMALCSSSALV